MSLTPVTNQNSSEETHRRPSRNIFEDPAIAAAAENDPFVRWVAKNWRILAVALLALAVSMVAYNRFVTVSLQKRSSATSALRDVQEGYDQLVTTEQELEDLRRQESSAPTGDAKNQLTKKVEASSHVVDQARDKLALMVESLDKAPPFDTIADLYRGLLAARRQDLDKTQSLLAARPWDQVGKSGSSERLVSELLTLALSRALIDSDKHREFARAQLLALSERGDFAAVQAGRALAIMAESDAERLQAAEIVSKLRARFPAQQKFLSDLSGNE